MLADLLPPDYDQDPRLESFPGLSVAADQRRLFCQGYWRALGTWSPSSWVLHLAVEVSGRPVGVQTLEGDDFPALRTVDTASWLTPSVRGRGLGVAMRTAALGFAFSTLEAVAAVSSAVPENAASLGVSRRLGYEDNGVGLVSAPGGRVVELRHLRLTAATWRSARHEVTVTGFEGCRPWFGL